MKSLLSIIAVVVLAGAGWYVYQEYGTTPPNADADTDTTQQEQRTAQTNANADTAEADALSAALVGTWESTTDANFTRTIQEDGTYRDAYADTPDATTSGTWTTFTSGNAPERFPYPTEENAQYLALDADEETLYFTVANVTENELELVYLNRGGVLTFTRVAAE